MRRVHGDATADVLDRDQAVRGSDARGNESGSDRDMGGDDWRDRDRYRSHSHELSKCLEWVVDSRIAGVYLLGRGRWGKYTPTSSLGTWTSFADASVAAQGYGGIAGEYGIGIGVTSISDISTDTFNLYTWDLASTFTGPLL